MQICMYTYVLIVYKFNRGKIMTKMGDYIRETEAAKEAKENRIREQTIFETLDRSADFFSSDDHSTIATNFYSEAINHAIDTVVHDKKAKVGGKPPNKKYVIRCLTLLGMEIFRGYPRVKELISEWEKCNLNKEASREEQKLYKDPYNPKFPIRSILKPFRTPRQIYVKNTVKDYLGEYNGYFKLTQGDMCLYFEVLGLLAVENPSEIYNDWVLDELKEIKILINERIFERGEEIEQFKRHSNKSIFENYLENVDAI